MARTKKGRARAGDKEASAPKTQTDTITNKRFVVPADEARGLEEWRRGLARRIATPARELVKAPNADVRAANATIRDAVSKLAGVRIQGTAIERANAYLVEAVARVGLGIRDQKDLPPIGFEPPTPPNGEFWWARTDWWWPGGIEAQNQTDGLHFFGAIVYDSDPLIHRSAGAVATFALDAARRPPSANGKWRSVAGVDLSGTLVGFTGFYHWMWAADDKWCKCSLDVRQTAFQIVGGLRIVVASALDHRMPINEENESRVVTSDLPGFIPIVVEFGLVDPGATVFVEIEVRFEMQLEGKSTIKFSPTPNPMNSVLLRIPQWKVQPI